jgi:hypothetical protein
MNSQIKPDIDLYYRDSNPINNYTSMQNLEPLSSKYYINMIKHDQNHFDFGVYNKLYQNLYPIQYSQNNTYFSPHQVNYPKATSLNRKDIYNTFTNIQEFSLLDKNLSNLSIEKYKKMREKDNYRTITNDDDTYKNKYNINCTESINEYKDLGNKLCKYDDMQRNNEINAKGKSIHLKNKIRLKKEIINYKKLEKKINKEIENKNKSQRKLKEYQHNYYSINFNNDEFKRKNNSNIINDFVINNLQMSNKISNKKLKRIKGGEDDLPNSNIILNSNKKTIEQNTNKKTDDNITSNFIKYLKKDNQKLLHINSIYKQLIDTFFYFVNQLSKKYSFNKDIKDVNYYLSNANHLSNILIDLEQHLNKMIKSNEINHTNESKEEKDNDVANEKELLNESKFININIKDKFKTLEKEKSYKTRNRHNNNKEYLTLNNKSVYSAKNIVNRTLHNNSLNYFSNIKEEGINPEHKISKKIFKVKKNSGKLKKAMNKLNFGFFSVNQNSNNKINLKNYKMSNNDGHNIHQKMNESNDLKSIINPIYINDIYKY